MEAVLEQTVYYARDTNIKSQRDNKFQSKGHGQTRGHSFVTAIGKNKATARHLCAKISSVWVINSMTIRWDHVECVLIGITLTCNLL